MCRKRKILTPCFKKVSYKANLEEAQMATTSFFTDFKVETNEVAEQLVKDLENVASEVVSTINVDEQTYEGDKLYNLFAYRSENY